MLNDPLVKSLLINVVEDEGNLPVVQCLIDGLKTDEEIAEKTEIRLNIVRKILYKLYDFGLASYKRSKDPETQWYTYAWKFESDEVKKHMEEDSKNTIKQLNEILNEEENNMFFICPEEHGRFDYNIASELDFICPECGEQLEFADNSDYIKRIKEEISICEKNYKSFSEKNK